MSKMHGENFLNPVKNFNGTKLLSNVLSRVWVVQNALCLRKCHLLHMILQGQRESCNVHPNEGGKREAL